jgi:hypothetical protein
MDSLIVHLESSLALSPEFVGGKAAKLALLLRQGLPVPQGFCVTTLVFPTYPETLDDPSFRKRLREFFEELVSFAGVPKKLIVRSSANCEDSKKAAFPGVFESTAEVETFDELLRAIRNCFSAARKEKVLTYCRMKGIDHETVQMAVLVQEYIQADYAGVALSQYTASPVAKIDGIYVELGRGASRKMLQGEQTGTAYLVREDDDQQKIVRLSRGHAGEPGVEASTLFQVAALMKQVNSSSFEGEVVEWVAQGGKVWIVQSRPLVAAGEARPSQALPQFVRQGVEATLLLPAAKEVGLKAAATQFFVNLGWFTKNVVLAPPAVSLSRLERMLQEAPLGGRGLTVRFSYKGDIGLPRFFARTKQEALELIRDHRDPQWTVIVHDYIEVKDSFEIFIDAERAVLEHVPGMWESWTALSPDVLINEAGRWNALRVPTSRTAHIIKPDGEFESEEPPVSRERIEYWARRLNSFSAEIRRHLGGMLPLICHCVSENQDEWQFLNIRKSGHLRLNAPVGRGFHVVATPEDLKTWDGKTPILLRILIERGAEETLAELVPELPERDDLIFIDFGALSHPAIMLRELGVNPTPIYLTHERLDLTEEMEKPR